MMKALEHIFYEEGLGAGTVQPGEEKAREHLSNVYLMGGVKKTVPECAQWYTFARTRDKGQKVKDKNFHLNRKKKYYEGGLHRLWSGDIQNPNGHDPDQSTFGAVPGEGRMD